MMAQGAKPTPITVRVPLRSRHEDASRQQRGKHTEHIAHLLQAGPVIIARK
jgi:hypothetical protein